MTLQTALLARLILFSEGPLKKKISFSFAALLLMIIAYGWAYSIRLELLLMIIAHGWAYSIRLGP